MVKSAEDTLFLGIYHWSKVNNSNYQLGLTTKIYTSNQQLSEFFSNQEFEFVYELIKCTVRVALKFKNHAIEVGKKQQQVNKYQFNRFSLYIY